MTLYHLAITLIVTGILIAAALHIFWGEPNDQ